MIKYKTILTWQQFETLLGDLRKSSIFSFDTETTGKNPFSTDLVGISFAVLHKPNEAYYIPLQHLMSSKQLPMDYVIKKLKPVLESPKYKKVGHGVKYDYLVLYHAGIKIQGIVDDTMIMSYLLEPNAHKNSLNEVGSQYLGIGKDSLKEILTQTKKANKLKKATMANVDLNTATNYAAHDAYLTLQLQPILREKLKKESLLSLYEKIEMPLLFILIDMELTGIKINSGHLKCLSVKLDDEIKSLEKEIYLLVGEEFNINSSQQLSKILFKKLGMISTKKSRKTNKDSTDIDVLKSLENQHGIIPLLLKYRHFAKLKSTYTDVLPTLVDPSQRLHTHFSQTTAATGRLASSDPNLQNIPVRDEFGKEIRKAFIPEKGNLFLIADYSQIELRILAHMSQDPVMLNVYRTGKDIHQETADSVFKGQLDSDLARFKAKIINFSINYGTSIKSLAKELGSTDQDAAKFRYLYFQKYKRVRQYMNEIIDETRSNGYSTTIIGRKRPVPELKSDRRGVMFFGERIALNNPIQGSAADIIKIAMIQVFNALNKKKLKTKMLLQVHDELIFEVPKKEKVVVEKIVKKNMEDISSYLKVKLTIPIEVNLGWGKDWTDAKH